MDRDTESGIRRRAFLRAATATGALAATETVTASHNGPEGNPLAGFGGTACDVPRTSSRYLPWDTDGAYGGWGGHGYHATEPGVRQNPVVFVHGNTHDACDWSQHATAYLERGYRGDELWSITFQEATSTHAEMARQLDDFVGRVLAETGADTVDVVSHSLGVTGVRLWMADTTLYDWPSVELADDEPAAGPKFGLVDAFVGCAGANHGTYTCGPCEKGVGSGEPCNVISPLCADEAGEPLFDLNHYGADCTAAATCPVNETPGDVDYYTIRANGDYFYLQNLESPELAGATNVVLSGRAHNATRASSTSIELIYEWVTDGPTPGHGGSSRTVSATGTRSDDGSVFTAGQTNRVDLQISAEAPAVLRDLIPYEWDVRLDHSDDVAAVAPRPHSGVTEVYFADGRPDRDHDVGYLVEAPSTSGRYPFGPAEVRAPGGTQWTPVEGTTSTETVVGVDTSAD